jgi:hypothetical protein
MSNDEIKKTKTKKNSMVKKNNKKIRFKFNRKNSKMMKFKKN